MVLFFCGSHSWCRCRFEGCIIKAWSQSFNTASSVVDASVQEAVVAHFFALTNTKNRKKKTTKRTNTFTRWKTSQHTVLANRPPNLPTAQPPNAPTQHQTQHPNPDTRPNTPPEGGAGRPPEERETNCQRRGERGGLLTGKGGGGETLAEGDEGANAQPEGGGV